VRPEYANRLIQVEYKKATEQFKPFNSFHEALAVLLEEYTELQAEIFKKPDEWDVEKIIEEAAQVGAMALRLLTDCC
jgi:hypothetical protein